MSDALYVLTNEYLEAANQLQDLDLDDETIRDTLEGLQHPIEQKATNIAFVIRNMESLAEQIKAAEQQMSARRKAMENRADNVREYLLRNMEACGISKIDSPYFKISIRNNPPSVVVDSEGLIPAEFMRQPEPPPPMPDKKAIKAVIESGQDVPGAHLARGTSLSIK